MFSMCDRVTDQDLWPDPHSPRSLYKFFYNTWLEFKVKLNNNKVVIQSEQCDSAFLYKRDECFYKPDICGFSVSCFFGYRSFK